MLTRLAAGLLLFAAPLAAAQTVSGTVTDDSGPMFGVNVVVEGTFVGTTTDVDGRYALDLDFDGGAQTLLFSYVSYAAERRTVTGPVTGLDVAMTQDILDAGAITVSASRTPERLLEAPVTVARVDLADLQRGPSVELMSSFERLKSVDVSRSGLLISSLSTRGFNSSKAERVLQLVDGVDYVSPPLSLYISNVAGPAEIDLESVEIVYGANSALYGANAFNGVILNQTKSPFQYTGATAQLRGGTRGMIDAQARWAQRVGDRFAYKLVGAFFEADEFIAENYAPLTTAAVNQLGADPAEGFRTADDPRGADVVSRFGETEVVGPGTVYDPTSNATLGALGLDGPVLTPGFSEYDLVEGDFRARAARVHGNASYLVSDAVRASYDLRYGVGNGLYQASNRYAFDGVNTVSNALSVEGERWNARLYVTNDGGGDTYDLGFLGAFMNLQDYEAAEGEAPIFPGAENLSYAQVYGTAYAGAFAQARATGASVEEAYAAAQAATAGVFPTLGEARFDRARDAVLADETPGRSARFITRGDLYQFDAQFRETLPSGFGVIAGGQWRRTAIDSDGTLYSDGPNSPISDPLTGARAERDDISTYDYGAYVQLRKALLDDRLSLSAIGRLDGFSDFDPRFSPRFAAVYTFGADRQHNLRANYSQAYRAPALLDRYIRLDIGRILLIGNANGGFEQLALDPVGLEQNPIEQLRLERVAGFEVGYKGFLTDRLLADVSYYHNRYTDFVGTRRFLGRESGGAPNALDLLSPPAPGDPGYADRTRVLQTWLNADQEITTQGFTVGAEYNVALPLRLRANYTWSDITEVDGLQLGFNTPEHKLNVGATGQLFEHVRYSTNVRTVSSYFYSMPFAEGTIDAHTVFDVQLGYQLPRFGAEVYGGATNLFDADNVTAYGSAPMGRLVFLGMRYTPRGIIQ